jgi:copper homeostasis protein (lipoprotein)
MLMKNINSIVFFLVLAVVSIGCNRKPDDATKDRTVVIKGLYSYGPEIRSFADCEEGREYWVVDSAKTLELAYSNMHFEKPYVPVYIEVECRIEKSDTAKITADYDSTMVVTKLLKITREIPDGPCNQ